MDHNNESLGNADQYAKPQAYFHAISKNVSTINPQMLDMTAITTELLQCNASIFLVQETNLAWILPTLLTIHAQCQQVHHHFKLAKSFSEEKIDNYYQSGWTLTLALGKWASQVTQSWGLDEVLGWWSYIKLVSQQGEHLIIVSAYCVCQEQFDATTNMVMAQQTCLLLQQGIQNPNPCKPFLTA